MSLSKSEALRLAKLCVSEDVTSVSISTIARLWGGMGQVYRVSSKDGDFIVKYMDPRRVSPSSIGDQRKLDSYVVEAAFYNEYSEKLIEKGVGLARFMHVERESNRTILCLSVLENAPNEDYYELVLEWLARFHAATWQQDFDSLQKVATYWHLDTRPDEWERLSSRGWKGRLKRAARAIDEFLKDETSIQSCVHGDAKDANVMWDGSKVAMCDFQYVGRGCPLKDLCYFLCSNGVADDESYVDLYYQKLCSKLSTETQPPSRKEFDVVLELCYCDYLRFMCGWGQWGSDITARVIKMLDKLDGGKDLGSEEEYREAIRSL